MKTVLITGCSSGFGLELVPIYLRKGWKVYATMRSSEKRKDIFRLQMEQYPNAFQLLELDVTKAEDRDRVASELEASGASLDCLVNNAGYGLFGALEDLSEAQIRHQIEVNYFGLLFLTQRLLPLLRKSKGRILNLSSAVGYLGLPFTSLYSSSKFAVEGLSESLYYELKPFGVQVCLLEPGRFRTSFRDKLNYGERSFDPFSPYFRFTKKFKAYRDRDSEGPGNPAYRVVDKIISLSEKKRIPLRMPIGRDAKVGFCLKKLLPGSLFFGATSFAFMRTLFGRGAE